MYSTTRATEEVVWSGEDLGPVLRVPVDFGVVNCVASVDSIRAIVWSCSVDGLELALVA